MSTVLTFFTVPSIEEGDYRIKGRFNEQNSKDIMQGVSVIVKSRLDDSTWKGEITSVDTSPQKNSGEDIYSYGSSDEMSLYIIFVLGIVALQRKDLGRV